MMAVVDAGRRGVLLPVPLQLRVIMKHWATSAAGRQPVVRVGRRPHDPVRPRDCCGSAAVVVRGVQGL